MMNGLLTYRVALFLGCLTSIIVIVGLVFLSERNIVADQTSDTVEPAMDPASPNNAVVAENLEYLDGLRLAYSRLNSVDLEATVKVKIISDTVPVVGDVKFKYLASGDKYRIQVLVPENLNKAGLLRSMEAAWNGRRYFFHDYEADVISYQSRESVQLPSAVPNPFLLPLDLFSGDDDSCSTCRLRLQDLKTAGQWGTRSKTIKVITSERTNGLLHDFLSLDGGKLNGLDFVYQVRIVGGVGERQISSISRASSDGRKLVESIFKQYKPVEGIGLKVPFETNVFAWDEAGRPSLTADFSINKLLLNKAIDDGHFEIDFGLAGRTWDSDAKVLVKK